MRTPGVADGFELVAGGDWIMPFPVAPLAQTDPGMAAIADILRGATLAAVNLETNLLHPEVPDLAPRVVDDWCLSADPAVAGDLASLNVRLVGRANNHGMDWGPAGMRATAVALDRAGIAHAGTGETLAAARAPAYVSTSHGRVAMVSIYPTTVFDPDAALDAFGRAPGRPGVHALRLQRVVTLPAQDLEAVRRVVRAIDPDAQLATPADPLAIDTSRFEEGPGTRVEVRYDPDPGDLAATLRSVRLGAQHADLVIVSIHAHQEGPDVATPPAYLQELARGCIDAGAGLVLGHGVHRLWPIELHDGRPICYGVGNAAFSDIQEPIHGSMHRFGTDRLPKDVDPATATDADVNQAALGPYFDDDRYYESILVRLVADDGAWRTTVIPIDLRRGEPLTRRGIPRPADPSRAELITKRLDAMSAPFGTSVDAAGAVGPT